MTHFKLYIGLNFCLKYSGHYNLAGMIKIFTKIYGIPSIPKALGMENLITDAKTANTLQHCKVLLPLKIKMAK